MARRSLTSLIFTSLLVSILVVTAYHLWVKKEEKKEAEQISETLLEKGFLSLLNKHPEALKEAYDQGILKMERLANQENEKHAASQYDQLKKAAINLGGNGSTASLISFMDPQCPHCQTFLQTMKETQKILPNVPLYVVLTPLLSSTSTPICKILLNASLKDNDTFFKANELLREHELNSSQLKEELSKIGIDYDAVIKDKKLEEHIKTNGDLAEKMKVFAVPTVYAFTKAGEAKLISPSGPEQLTKIIDSIEKTGSFETE